MDALAILGELRQLGSSNGPRRQTAKDHLVDAKPEIVCRWILNLGLLTSQQAAQTIDAALLLGILGGPSCIQGLVRSMKLDPADGSVIRAKLVALANMRQRDPVAFDAEAERLQGMQCEGLVRMREAAQHWRDEFIDDFLLSLGVPPKPCPPEAETQEVNTVEPIRTIAFWVDQHGVIRWWGDVV